MNSTVTVMVQSVWGGEPFPIRYRRTPAGEPSVRDLVGPGDIVYSNYHPCRCRVVSISKDITRDGPYPFCHEYPPANQLVLSPLPSPGKANYCYSTLLVAVGGRLLSHRADSDDEWFVVEKVNRRPMRQLRLFS